jgi:S-methylmethionine-dependent homocysteine/selenocysteine methylase
MKPLTLLDGGMGRELKRIGAPFSQPLWSAQALIESPQHVTHAHQRFIDAGAEIIITNSYACVPFHLGEECYRQQGAQLARLAATLAKDVSLKHPNVHVAGCLPPPLGSYRPDLFDEQRAEDIYQTLYSAQHDHVDLWMVETLSSIAEFKSAQTVLSSSTLPSYYAFSLQDTIKEAACIRSGETVTDAIQAVINAGENKVLFNCSMPEVMLQAVVDAKLCAAKQSKEIELGVYANNFTAIDPDHQANTLFQAERSVSPDEYLRFARQWYDAGATIIGGCCGIGPEHIKRLSEWKASLES